MSATAVGGSGFVREVTDLDCAAATAQDLARIRSLLFEHRVLVIPGQDLPPVAYLRFMAALGAPIRHVLQELTVDGHAEILKISDYVQPDGVPYGVLDGGSYWHSDMSYLPVTGVATALYAVRAVPGSGATAFLDLVEGWRLVRRDRQLLDHLGCAEPDDLDGVEIIHRFGNRRALTDPTAATQKLTADQQRTLSSTRHGLVERHPVTGRPGLYASCGSAMEVAGLDAAASTRALDRLEELLLAGLGPYTHRYRPGDLVLWDNMSTLHRGVEVRPTRDHERSRLLHRINVNYSWGVS